MGNRTFKQICLDKIPVYSNLPQPLQNYIPMNSRLQA
jgi:hypothetical protein